MPIPTVYTPIQPLTSIVAKPVTWTPNVWTAVASPTCAPSVPPVSLTPPPPVYGEIFTVTVSNFTPIINPVPYSGDPGLVVTLEAVGFNAVSGIASGGTGIATATVQYPGTITMRVTGTYTDYLFPNKEYKYRNDLPGGVIHAPVPVTSPSGKVATYGTLNQGTATIRSPLINPIGGVPTAGTPTVGVIEEIPPGYQHMQGYTPDPNYFIIVEYTVVITSSCGIGAGTFPIKQIVYDDKDISSARFVKNVKKQAGRDPTDPKISF